MGVRVSPGAPKVKEREKMQKMTPTKIFRKAEIATELVMIFGVVIAIGVLASILVSIF